MSSTTPRQAAKPNRRARAARLLTRTPRRLCLALAFTFALSLHLTVFAQTRNGNSPSPPQRVRPRTVTPTTQTTQPAPTPAPALTPTTAPAQAAPASRQVAETVDEDEVVRVDSNLVLVPASVVDNRGRAITDLKLDDFELRVDGQVKTISDLGRAETPVLVALLFDNSASLSAAREFEKRAATRFFQSVVRPIDRAAVYSISTVPQLAQPLTGNVQRLVNTIEGFPNSLGSWVCGFAGSWVRGVRGVREVHWCIIAARNPSGARPNPYEPTNFTNQRTSRTYELYEPTNYTNLRTIRTYDL